MNMVRLATIYCIFKKTCYKILICTHPCKWGTFSCSYFPLIGFCSMDVYSINSKMRIVVFADCIDADARAIDKRSIYYLLFDDN